MNFSRRSRSGFWRGGRGQPPRKWARASPVRACSSVALEDPSRGVCACTRTPPGQQQATTCPRRTKPTRPPPPLLPPAARARVSQPAAAAGPRGAGPWLDSAAAVPGKGRAGPRGARASCSARGAGAAPGRRSSTRRAAGLRDRALSRDLGAGGERDGRPRVAWVSGRPARATPRPRVLARARCRAPAGRAAGACGGWSFVSARASPRLHARRCAIARGSRCPAED